MNSVQKNYFLMIDDFMGEVYFRVSQHLGIVMSEVIRKKFHPDMMLLIHKYSNIVRNEIKQSKKLEDELKKSKQNI